MVKGGVVVGGGVGVIVIEGFEREKVVVLKLTSREMVEEAFDMEVDICEMLEFAYVCDVNSLLDMGVDIMPLLELRLELETLCSDRGGMLDVPPYGGLDGSSN